jgi:hypothetical protein
MNIQGGAIEFDVLFNSGQIERALEETKRRIQGFSNATVAGGAKMEEAYKAATNTIEKGFQTVGNAIRINQDAISGLQNKYNELKQAAANAFMSGTASGNAAYIQYNNQADAIQRQINEHQKLNQQLQSSDAELLKYNNDLEDTKNKVDNASNANVRFRTQLLNVKNEMMTLEQAGKKNTAEYARLTEEAKRLANAMYAANQQIKTLTSVKGAALQGLVSGLSGISGAFTAAQGAMGLFANKNEDLQRIMLKVQSLMSITMGLQAVSATLHQTSAFRLTVLTKVQATYSAAVAATGKALIGFGMSATAARMAAQALMATLTLGLGVAITAIVTLVTKYISKQNEAKKATEEFNKKVAEAAAKPIATINELSTAWSKLGDNIKAKEKFIDDNKDKFNSLGTSVKNVADAENLLIQNKSKFIEAQLLKAKAIAAQELAIEKYKKVIEAQDKLDSTPKAWITKNGEYTDGYGVKRKGKVLEKSRNWKEAEEDLNKAQQEYDKFQEKAMDFSTQTEEILSEITANMGKLTEGSIAELQKDISKLKEQYNNAATDLQRNDLFKQIQEKEKLLAKTDLLQNSKSKDKKDPFTKELEEKKKSYQEYFKWVNAGFTNEAKQEFATLLESGKTYKEYLQNRLKETSLTKDEIHKLNTALAEETNKTVMQEFEKGLQTELNNARSILEMLNVIEQKRKDLETDESGLKEQKTEVLDKQQEDVAKKAEDETKQLLKSYSDYLEEKINFELLYGERKKKLDEDLAKATAENERKIILAQLDGLEKDRKKYEKRTGNENYDNLLEEYRSFEQKKADISKEYDDKIALATEQKNEQLAQRLAEEKNKSLSSVALNELQKSGTWEKLFGNLDDLTTKQIEELIAKIEAQRAQLGVELSPKDLEAILSNLQEAKDEIQSRNPFKALQTAIKDYGKAVDDETKKKSLTNIFKSAAGSIDLVKGSLNAVTDGMKKMGIQMDEETQAIIDNIGGILDGASQLATGIASGNPLSIIQGTIGVISSGLSLLDVSSNKRNKRLQEEIEYYNTLVEVYDKLIDRQKELTKSLSGKEAVDAYEKGIKMASAQTVAAKKSLQSWFDSGAGMFSHSEGYNYNESFGNILSQQKLLTMSAEEWVNLMGGNTELWARLPQQVRDYAQTVMDAGDTTKELAAAMKEALVGFTMDEATSGIMNLVSQADLAFSEISESFYEHMKKAILRIVQTKTISGALETWYDNFSKDMKDGVLSEDEVRARQAEYEDIVKKGQAAYAAAMKVTGIEIDELVNGTLSGAIKGASQESIDLLAGQTNAVRVNQVQSIEIMRNSLIQMTMINAKVSISNQHLESIDSKLNNVYDHLRSQGITGG